MTEDECSGCEGWAEVDHRDLCSGCAHEIDNNPYHVVEAFSKAVVDPGPFTSVQADLRVRVHNYSMGYAGRSWVVERVHDRES